MSGTRPDATGPANAVPVTAFLIGTIALQTAVPPFATDMYTPAFPQVTADLGTTASLVGLTLTTFFLGFALGQVVGGPWSDQHGRRRPLLIGGLICGLGGIGCALSPTIGFLIAARIMQGFGGGIASAVARAVIVDVARGNQLARIMSVMQAIGGLAPMIAPVLGALVITVSTWRSVFWTLAGFGALMVVTATLFIRETLPPERRHGGGLRQSMSGIGDAVRNRVFIGYVLTGSLSSFAMMGYVANSSYVLQVMKGLRPFQFSMFFASTALSMVLLSLINARLIGRVSPRRMITIGLSMSAVAITVLTAGVLWWNTPLVLTCATFLVIMAAQGFVFGNAGALGAMQVTHVAGSAAAVQGVATSVAMAISAPLASAGGGTTAVPMVMVMLVGITGAILSFAFGTR